MSLADVEVGAVVGGGHLQDAGTKFFLNRGIADDWDLGAREGPPDVLSDEMLVALVIRMDGDGGVAWDRLGTRGGDLEERARNLGHLVAHAVERALGGLHDHLFVGKAGLRDRAPVDHALAAIDIAALVERDKGLQHRLRVAGVERMDGTIPVARSAEFAELPENDAAVLVAPFGRNLDEFLAAEVVARFAFFLTEFFLDAGLRGDAGVVGAWKPEGGFAFLSSATDHDVLERVVE